MCAEWSLGGRLQVEGAPGVRHVLVHVLTASHTPPAVVSSISTDFVQPSESPQPSPAGAREHGVRCILGKPAAPASGVRSAGGV